MNDILIEIPDTIYSSVWAHLLPRRMKNEEVCFIYVRPRHFDGAERFEFLDWDPVPPEGFTFRSGYHVELTDGTQARIIKRAHDLEASIVEMHSHLGSLPAAFSPSDMAGFAEFVPHVIWRLRGKPYFAVVVNRGSFDGFVWLCADETPFRLGGIKVGSKILKPTKISFCGSP